MNQGYPQYPQQYSNPANVIPMQMNINNQQTNKNLFQSLDNKYKYQIIKPSNSAVQTAIVILRDGWQIKLDVNYNFQIPPTIIFHNMPYNYTKFYQWNNQSNLVELIQKVDEQLHIQTQVLNNPVLTDYSEFVISFNIEAYLRKIKNLGLQQLLPGLQQQDYYLYLQNDEKLQSLRNQLIQISDLRELKEKMIIYSQHSENIASLIENNDKYLQDKQVLLQKKNAILQDEQYYYMQLQNRAQAIQERFQDSKVYQQMQGICEQYDEESNKILDETIDQKIDHQMNEYFQIRKKYQRMLIIGEKFRQMKQI